MTVKELRGLIRASSMSLLANCPAAAVTDGVQIDSYDPTATEGTEIHRAIALAIRGEDYPLFMGDGAAEAEDMVKLALAYVEREKLGDAQTETHIEAPPFAATLDLLLVDGTVGIVTEWKSTHREDDHTAQILAQAACALARHADLNAIDSRVVYLRGEGEVRHVYTRAWVEAWVEEFKRNTLDHPEVYRPGEWCGRCRRKTSCPALAELNRSTALALADPKFTQALTRESVAALRPRVKLLASVIDQYDKWVRAEVLANGPISLGGGKVLGKLEMHIDKIDLIAAYPLLAETFSTEDLRAIIEVHKTAMLTRVADGAAKGQKTAAKDGFMAQLRALGAVETVTTYQVRELNER